MKTIIYVVKTTTGEIFTSTPQPLHGVSRPMVGEYLKTGKPIIVETSEGPIYVNTCYIVYVQEIIND